MSGSVNKVILIGHLGRDPEVRRTSANEPVATLRIATSDSWKDKATGERKERTEWHTVVVFNTSSAEFADRYLKKGAKVYIEGQLQTRKWTDQSGQDRYTTEVVLQKFKGELTPLDKRESNRPPAADSQDDYGHTTTRESTPQNQNYSGQIDDDIPF